MPPFLSGGINPPLPWAPAGVNPKKLLRKSLGGSERPWLPGWLAVSARATGVAMILQKWRA